MKQADVLPDGQRAVEITRDWQGGFHAKAYMRTHAVEMDEPRSVGRDCDLAASAHEQLLVGHWRVHDGGLRVERDKARRENS